KVEDEVEDEDEDEIKDKVKDEAEDEDEDLDIDLDQDLHSFNDPNVQQQLDLLNAVIQDMYQSQNPQAQSQNLQVLPYLLPHSQDHIRRVKKLEKERNFGMNDKLLEL